MVTTKIPKNIPYKKFRWFVTSSGKLVIGGKNAEQNEELVKMCMKGEHLDLDHRTSLEEWSAKKKKYVVMHTKNPGSPFSMILDENCSEKDLEETAIFTASFSRNWRQNKKETVVDLFLLEQVYKEKEMKVGTFGVMDTIDHKKSPLKLCFKKQNNVLRCVPFDVPNSIVITPGRIPKEKFAVQLADKYKVSIDEALNALPTGSFDFEVPIIKKKITKKTKKKIVKKKTKKGRK
jgi:hypothetical protein